MGVLLFKVGQYPDTPTVLSEIDSDRLGLTFEFFAGGMITARFSDCRAPDRAIAGDDLKKKLNPSSFKNVPFFPGRFPMFHAYKSQAAL